MNSVLWISILILIGFLIKVLMANHNLRKKYSDIINIDEAVEKRLKEKINIEEDIKNIKTQYSEKYKIYEELNQNIDLLSDNLEMLDLGIYEPHFNWQDSERYKIALTHNKDKQKAMVKDKKAVVCDMEWTVGGSRKEGKQMVDRYIKLMLKAFNGECDSIICNVRWNNVKRMEERINKVFKDLNKLGENTQIEIMKSYLHLKKEELWLTYEHEQKKQDEKEEQKRIREKIREEEKLQKEIEKKQKEIEQQEKEKARIEKIRQEAYEKGQFDKAQECEDKINELQLIIDNGNRHLSEAQKTKVGNVYVISNIGSFGENVYKIGMTRRLEPQERVDELGDASVPFKFDVHAMIKSDDAPALENKLHELFKTKSVNRVNYRKEFFRVTLEEIEQAVKEYTNADIEFTKIAEAKEYRETQAILLSENNKEEKIIESNALPSNI